jgi:hypothetical protein
LRVGDAFWAQVLERDRFRIFRQAGLHPRGYFAGRGRFANHAS